MQQSVIHYKWANSARPATSIFFTGPVISVLDCKRAIVKQQKLAETGENFDLKLKDASTGEGSS
jgi:hypothetical protein